GQDGHPVALADGGGGAGGQERERGDLDPAGDVLAGAPGGDLQGQAELDAVGAVAGGEAAGVIAEAAGDGDADRVHGVPPGAVPGRDGRPGGGLGTGGPFPAPSEATPNAF